MQIEIQRRKSGWVWEGKIDPGCSAKKAKGCDLYSNIPKYGNCPTAASSPPTIRGCILVSCAETWMDLLWFNSQRHDNRRMNTVLMATLYPSWARINDTSTPYVNLKDEKLMHTSSSSDGCWVSARIPSHFPVEPVLPMPKNLWTPLASVRVVLLATLEQKEKFHASVKSCRGGIWIGTSHWYQRTKYFYCVGEIRRSKVRLKYPNCESRQSICHHSEQVTHVLVNKSLPALNDSQ